MSGTTETGYRAAFVQGLEAIDIAARKKYDRDLALGFIIE